VKLGTHRALLLSSLFFSHGGRVSVTRGPGRKPGASSIHAEACLYSLTGGRAETWCLLIHAEESLSHRGQGIHAYPVAPPPLLSLTLSLFSPRASQIRPEHVGRYRANAPLYVREEAERADRWDAFLERGVQDCSTGVGRADKACLVNVHISDIRPLVS